MKRNIILGAIAMLFSASFAAAADMAVDFDRGGFNYKEALKNTVTAAPDASAVAVEAMPSQLRASQAEWTIMVFVNGKNNLEKFALRDMNEMEMIGSTDKVNIVVELGRMAGFDSSDGDWTGVRRYLVQKDNDPYKITSPVVQDLGMKDMGSYQSVIDFGNWAKQNYPAKKYMLIFWNHGAGWIKSVGLYGNKGISYDDQSNNHIDTPQMAKILQAIGGVTVMGSDACLMQMAEVVYEVKNHVPYIVGSEETEPGDGYTYNTFLDPVVKNPSMTGAQLARVAVDAYSDHYDAQSGGYTQSFVYANAVPQFLQLVNAFAYEVTKANDVEAAKYARDNAVKFAYPENKDLYDFVSLLISKSNNKAVKEKGQALMNYITHNLVGHNRTKDEPGSWWSSPNPLSRAKGIAVYLPNKAVPASYQEMQWAKYSNWDEFVAWLASK
ncbi:MAG: hypothetical protein K5838_00980 [Elusimicrobiales bacterium]|nr:hypothetical protein [Elusimicrobiales bacterium]